MTGTHVEDWLAWKHEQALDAVGGGVMALPTAPRVPANSEAQMRCEHLRCVMAGRVCVERQGSVFLVRNEGHRRTVPNIRFGHCTSGKCEQGKEVRQALGELPDRPALALPQRRRGAASTQTALPPAPLVPLTRLERPRAAPRPLSGEERAELAAAKNPSTTTTKAPAIPAKEEAMAKLLDDKTDDELLQLVDKHGSISGAARELGVSAGTLNTRIVAARAEALRAQQALLTATGVQTNAPVAASSPIEDTIRARLEFLRGEIAKLRVFEAEAIKLERMLNAAAA